MVDLVGIEPTTSSMPFPSTNCTVKTASESKRQRWAVFMRFSRLSAAVYLYASDTLRTHPTPAGMGGLRHKSGHNFPLRQGVAPRPSIKGLGVFSFSPFAAVKNSRETFLIFWRSAGCAGLHHCLAVSTEFSPRSRGCFPATPLAISRYRQRLPIFVSRLFT